MCFQQNVKMGFHFIQFDSKMSVRYHNGAKGLERMALKSNKAWWYYLCTFYFFLKANVFFL